MFQAKTFDLYKNYSKIGLRVRAIVLLQRSQKVR